MPHGTVSDDAQRLSFSGRGAEYFRIWIVNIALSILTLGIYSAWAKVRRLKYFYLNTTLADSSFDFHGDPLAILKGRVIAVVLLLAYQLSGVVSPYLALVAMVLLALAFPWLIVRSLRFKLHNSSHRGLRFSFRGGMKQGYVNFLLYPLLALVTLYLLSPLAHHRIKRFQHGTSWYANTPFAFSAGSGRFFTLYLQLLGLVVLVIVLVTLGAALLFPFELANPDELSEEAGARLATFILASLAGIYLMLFLLLGPWFSARVQNLVWNHTTLGPHRLVSDVQARALFWLYLTNFLGIVATLGLFKPFADIRLARYRLQHIGIVPSGELEDFMADQQQATSATGEEAADLFDFDISF
jgi:uncharacterized membrane protein YjgN (DUF898 family)